MKFLFRNKDEENPVEDNSLQGIVFSLSACLSVCLFVCLSFYHSVCLSACMPASLFVRSYYRYINTNVISYFDSTPTF